MVSHLVGGEAHVARCVQVQVLLLPPRSGVPGDRSSLLGLGSVGHLESPSRSKRDVPSGLARSTRAATANLCASSFVPERMNQMTPSIKQIVKDNMARFSFYRTGNMFYIVDVEGQKYQFPVSLEDMGGATLTAEFKAITLMRYIRKALADGTFVRGT